MSLLRFISQYAASRWPRLIGWALLTGASQTGILICANYGVHALGHWRILLGIGFLLCCLTFILSSASLTKTLTVVIEEIGRAHV